MRSSLLDRLRVWRSTNRARVRASPPMQSSAGSHPITSTDVALMIDGVPINQPVNGHSEGYADWNEMMPEAVSTIRVLKGPVSPWIGNFGMGGEVEVETISLAQGTRWALRSGSFGDARASDRNGGTTAQWRLCGCRRCNARRWLAAKHGIRVRPRTPESHLGSTQPATPSRLERLRTRLNGIRRDS
jgi:hypothetical protein